MDKTATSEDERPYPPRFWWFKRIAVVAALLLLTPFVTYFWWRHVAERRFSDAIAMYQERGEPILPADFVLSAIPDEQNAVVPFCEAVKELRMNSAEHDLLQMAGSDSSAMSAQQRVVFDTCLANNSAVFPYLREARQRRVVSWSFVPGPPAAATGFPTLREQSDLARLLNCGALDSHRKGDDQSAVELIRDSFFLARAIGHGPRLTLPSVFDSCAAEALTRLAPTLQVEIVADTTPNAPARPATAEQVRALIHDLVDESWRQTEATMRWRGERMFILDATQREVLPAAGAMRPIFQLYIVRTWRFVTLPPPQLRRSIGHRLRRSCHLS